MTQRQVNPKEPTPAGVTIPKGESPELLAGTADNVADGHVFSPQKFFIAFIMTGRFPYCTGLFWLS